MWDRSATLIALCALSISAVGEETGPEIPDDAFLEFLASWETEEGEWVDPFEFSDEAITEETRKRLVERDDDEHEDDS